jgi:hypothetical protein
MPEISLQKRSVDGCIYVYCQPEKRWYRFSPVSTLPADIVDWVDGIKHKAAVLADAACPREEGEDA